MSKLSRQDLNGARTPTDLQRRYKFQKQAEEVEEMKKTFKVDNKLSVTSTNPVQNKVITESLNNKVNKETGKVLSSNDYTDEEKEKLEGLSNYDDSTIVERLETLEENSHTHQNKEVLDDITAEEVDNWNNAVNKTNSKSYDLSKYKVSDLTITRSSCINKNDRVVINVLGTINIPENTMTTLFNLPIELCPSNIKDFLVFGQDSNNVGSVGYGNLTNEGKIEISYNKAVTSIMFSFVYDLE